MADPVSMVAIAGMGASAGGAIMGAIGNAYGGQAQANMYNYRAGVAQMNKNIALQNADYAREAGEVSAQESGMKTRYVVGEEKAKQGASGLDVNRGSAVDVRTSQLEVGAEDQAIIRTNAARRAYGYEVEAAGSEAQANLYTMAASTAKTAGWLGSAGSLIGGAGSVADKWLQYKSNFGDSGGNPTDVGSAIQTSTA